MKNSTHHIEHSARPPLTAAQGIQAWQSGLQSGAELTAALRDCMARAKASTALSIWIHLCPDEQFQEQLQTLQLRLQEPLSKTDLLKRYPLLGVPFAVKDNIDIAGAPTTAACPAFAHTAQDSATVVHKLLQAGAVWIGKTNLDQFATGLVGTRSPYGKPASVFDDYRVSGGSSSGSAVAVARGQVLFALGTDTAGSGRIPAAFNGLVGLKPTPGRVSTAGVLPACRTLDCVSVFAQSVPDASLVLAVIEGPDARDSYSDFKPGSAGPSYTPIRLGIPRLPMLDPTLQYPAAWQAALAQAKSCGFELVELDFEPLHQVAAMLYDGPWVAERYSVIRSLLQEQPDAIDGTVRQVVGKATQFSATQTFEAFYRLQSARKSSAEIWEQCDALLVPTSPAHPTFAEVEADPIGSNARLGHYTNFVNLLNWCALAMPAGQTAAGLPFGVTLIGAANQDVLLLNLAARWTNSAPATTTNALQPATAPTLQLAVVGAHLSGLPLNGQLIERGATLLQASYTAPLYRLYALPGTTPPKPGLVRVADGGQAIAVEIWAMPQAAVGSFLALIPAPLGLGSLQLQDGSHVHGFLCESHALVGAQDITAHGGWRAYIASLVPRN